MTKPFLSDFDLHLLSEGTLDRIYEKLGAHVVRRDGEAGTHFAVWAPAAREVSVVGDFNGWNPDAARMERLGPSGAWAVFIPNIGQGATYKYSILPPDNDRRLEKSDPYAFAAEVSPRNASKVWDLAGHDWGDTDWMARRAGHNRLDAPIAIYEVHLGSWRRVPEQGNRPLSYREAAPLLADHAAEMGFTHVELMPVAEYPLDKSWGYQLTGYYAATSRFGTPQELMFLIDTLHQRGLGVIMDFVPAHFATDPHGLGLFDGTHIYEPADPLRMMIGKWGSYNFDYANLHVVNFLVGNALFWLDRYHIDALRVDGIEAILHLDFGKGEGEWRPNRFGGRENLEAIDFLRKLNDRVHTQFPGVITIAEDPTTHPKVTRPVAEGGLGFDLKWDLGWVHDTLDQVMTLPPPRRKDVHDKLTFRMEYAGKENYLLPLGHDEVVYGKGSLLGKMPGDDWQKFANLRLLLGYMYTIPGKKLLFMGGEFAQWREWNYNGSLDWHLLDDPRHAGLKRWVRDLNTQYRAESALHQGDCDLASGFAWVDADDVAQSVLCFLRKGRASEDVVLVVCNFTATPRKNYRVGVPRGGRWVEVLNGDAPLYGGSGQGNMGSVATAPIPWHGQSKSLNLVLPPLSIIALKPTP
ncbi:MAG: 1,4-alpha-glucan branching protein GlgB [Isosphaeraceae bacterium]